MKEPSEPTRCTIDVEVRYAETDQMGVVHHANYVVWFELVRTHLCALSGFHYADIEAMGYLLMVTGVEARYRQPARYGDVVQVVCWGSSRGAAACAFTTRCARGRSCSRPAPATTSGSTPPPAAPAASPPPCARPSAGSPGCRRSSREGGRHGLTRTCTDLQVMLSPGTSK